MNNEFERPQWPQHLEERKETESSGEILTSDIFCNKNCALIDCINDDLLAADFKWSLFCAAGSSYRFDSVLKPFPPFFLLEEGVKDIERLREVIELCPSLSTVLKQLKNNTLPSTLKDLLFWVLIHINEPKFKFIAKEEHINVLSLVSSEIPPTMPDFIFSVTYNSRHQKKFALNASNFFTKFAYHGSRLDNFYSVVNYGLQVSFNKVAVFGPGIYLSKEITVSLPYSPRGFTWSYSLFGSHISILAICEVIDHPDIKSELDSNTCGIFECKEAKSIPGKYLIVENSDLVRIRYLLVYGNDSFESNSIAQSPTLLGWIKRHKIFTFVLGYIIFLLGIGSSNSSLLYKYFRRLLRRFDNSENQW